METLSLIGNAFAGMMNPMSILLLIVGVAVGIVFGSIPGLSAAMAVALFLPVTFAMQAHEAFTLLVALYIGGISGGLISAILINIPGTSSSIATCFDGSPMAKKGEAGKALGYSGGGRKMIAQYEAPDKPAELFSPRLYGTGLRHKHLTEMQKVAGLEQPPVFCPVVDDYYKGMATTIQLHNRYLRGQPTAREICHILAAYYAGQPLVSVRWGGDAPTLPANALAGTDRLELVVCGHEEQTIVTALFDNLGKGASGAAVQNMNLMLGFEMTAGLALETPPAGSPASARSERT